MKKLPFGTQSFEKFITSNGLYLNKTALIYDLLTKGKTYFLSRPRRFGRSLLLSTIESIFQGKKQLFTDFAIRKTDWSRQPHPVIRLDFLALTSTDTNALAHDLIYRLREIAAQYAISLPEQASLQQLFIHLITKLASINNVVILIDEYDKPLIESIQHPERIDTICGLLKNLYSIIHSYRESIQFALITGISQLNHAGLFSDLVIEDISRNPAYASLLGCTEQDIDRYFSVPVQQLAKRQQLSVTATRTAMRQWYHGFRFAHDAIDVYPIASLQLLFSQLSFGQHWFNTTASSFLIKQLRQANYSISEINTSSIGTKLFSSYDIRRIDVTRLLLQTGYLTIKRYHPPTDTYAFDFPNQDVARAFHYYLVPLFRDVDASHSTRGDFLPRIDDYRAGVLLSEKD